MEKDEPLFIRLFVRSTSLHKNFPYPYLFGFCCRLVILSDYVTLSGHQSDVNRTVKFTQGKSSQSMKSRLVFICPVRSLDTGRLVQRRRLTIYYALCIVPSPLETMGWTLWIHVHAQCFDIMMRINESPFFITLNRLSGVLLSQVSFLAICMPVEMKFSHRYERCHKAFLIIIYYDIVWEDIVVCQWKSPLFEFLFGRWLHTRIE